MKYLVIIFCFLGLSTFAQSDSLTIKLKQLKELKDSSLISQTEYEQLKAKALGLENKEVKNVNKDEVVKLQKKLKGKIIATSIGAVFCAGGVIGTITTKNKPIVPQYDGAGNIDQKSYDFQKRTQKNNVIMLGAFSGIMGVFTIVNLATIEGTANKLQKAKKGLTFNPSINGLSIAYNF